MAGIIKNGMITVFLLIMLAGCEKKQADTESILYDNGLAIAEKMGEMTQSDTYISLYGSSDELNEMIKKAADGEYTEPAAVCRITLNDDVIELVLGELESGYDGLSENLKNEIEKRCAGALVSLVNGYSGAAAVAAASVIRADDCFVCEGVKENLIYMYVFEKGFPVLVTFIPGKDDAVYASGSFLMNDKLWDASGEDMREILDGIEIFSWLSMEEIRIN